MPKFFGAIGFADHVETSPGIWEEPITEHEYYGDLIRNTRRLQSVSDRANDNVLFNNQISIVADPYACEHFADMRYVIFQGTKWKVSDVEVQYPRLVLSLGGVYND